MNLNQSRVKVLNDIESLHRVEDQLNQLKNEFEKGRQERLEQGDCFSFDNECSSSKNDKNKSPGPSIKMITIMSRDSSPSSSSSSTNSPISDTDQNKQSKSQHLINRNRSKYQTNKDDIAHYRFHQLEEELKVTRERLARAENSLAIKKWSSPHQLQLWLQLTYELELANCIAKRQAAEAQLITAKDGCDKLRRKRSSFLGSFRVAHGSSIDDVDGKIIQAKRALSEVTKELKERLHRWQQIENLCGFNIVYNKGLPHIQAELFAGDSNSHSVNELADLSGASDVDTTTSGMAHEIEANDYTEVFGLHRTSSFARSSFRRSIRSNHSFDKSTCMEAPSSPRHLKSHKKDDDGFDHKDFSCFGEGNSRSFDFHSNQNVSHYSTNCPLISPDDSVMINPPLLSPRHRRTWSSIRRHPRRRNPPSIDPQFNGRTLGSEKSFSLNLLAPELNGIAKISNRMAKNTTSGQLIPSGMIPKPSKIDHQSIESVLNPVNDALKPVEIDNRTTFSEDQNDIESKTEQLDTNNFNMRLSIGLKMDDGDPRNTDERQVPTDKKLDCIEGAQSKPEKVAIASTSQNLSKSEPCVCQENCDDKIDPVGSRPLQEVKELAINGQDSLELAVSPSNSFSHDGKRAKKAWSDYLRSARKPLAFLAWFTRKKFQKR